MVLKIFDNKRSLLRHLKSVWLQSAHFGTINSLYGWFNPIKIPFSLASPLLDLALVYSRSSTDRGYK